MLTESGLCQTFPTEVSSSAYLKSSNRSIRQLFFFFLDTKYGQSTEPVKSKKNIISKCPISNWEGAQQHYISRTCKLQPECVTVMDPSVGLNLKQTNKPKQRLSILKKVLEYWKILAGIKKSMQRPEHAYAIGETGAHPAGRLVDRSSPCWTELEVRPGPAPRHWAPAYVFERMTIDIAQNTHTVRLRAALFIISQDGKKQQNTVPIQRSINN